MSSKMHLHTLKVAFFFFLSPTADVESIRYCESSSSPFYLWPSAEKDDTRISNDLATLCQMPGSFFGMDVTSSISLETK
jgi:hypothetical protein